jgi:uncharacterized protein
MQTDRYSMPSLPTSFPADRTGVSDFMTRTYAWMALGLTLTGAVAWFVAQTPALAQIIVQNRGALWILLLAQVGLVIAFSATAHKASTPVAAAMFTAYAALTGVTFSVLFFVYTRTSIAQTFFITAGTFAGLSAFGALTKRDLSGVGRFMTFGLIGLVIASLVNIFLQSPAVMWISTYAGVLIFAGLTAYDTQALIHLYRTAGAGGNLALRGALTLYLDFINMFLFLLRLFGGRRD